MFIDALGELVSAAAGEEPSAAEPIVLEPAGMLASDPVGALEALSADELGADALSLMVSPCCMCVSLAMGFAVSPMPDCALAVLDVSGWLAAGSFVVDCALTAPGIMMAAAARRSTLRMV